MTLPPVAGLILAGGKSKRMGFDKGLIPANGLPQVRYLYRLLSRWVTPVFVSVGPGSGDEPAYAGMRVVRDPVEEGGPLAGIVRGHEEVPESALIIVAVDMFGLDDAFVAYLLETRLRAVSSHTKGSEDGGSPSRFITALEGTRNIGSTCLPEFLCAVWEPLLLNQATAAFSSGERRPHRVIQCADMCLVPRRGFRVFNLNTPDDLRSYKSSPAKEEFV